MPAADLASAAGAGHLWWRREDRYSFGCLAGRTHPRSADPSLRLPSLPPPLLPCPPPCSDKAPTPPGALWDGGHLPAPWSLAGRAAVLRPGKRGNLAFAWHGSVSRCNYYFTHKGQPDSRLTESCPLPAPAHPQAAWAAGAPGPSALGAAGKPTSPLQTPPAFHSSFFFLFASFKRQRRFVSWPVRGSEGQATDSGWHDLGTSAQAPLPAAGQLLLN